MVPGLVHPLSVSPADIRTERKKKKSKKGGARQYIHPRESLA